MVISIVWREVTTLNYGSGDVCWIEENAKHELTGGKCKAPSIDANTGDKTAKDLPMWGGQTGEGSVGLLIWSCELTKFRCSDTLPSDFDSQTTEL
jgi:hypothetical protein